jgi:hypothetical protein
MKGYQPRTNTVKDEKGDLFTATPKVFAGYRNLSFQLFNVYGFSDVRLREMHTAEPLVTEPSC